METRAAIYGAGAMGTVLGAYIAKAGKDVILVSRNRKHVDALKKSGAHITGMTDFTVPVKACLPEDMTGKYDVIFLMTKQRENEEVVKFLLPYLEDSGVICTMQNGLPESSVAAVCGSERCCGCAVSWGATLSGGGESRLTTRTDGLTFALGTLYGNEDKLDMVKPYLACMGKVSIEKNFIGARWSKLAANCAFSALSAMSGMSFGQLCDDKYARSVVQAVLKECFDVAVACGVRPARIQGYNMSALLNYKRGLKKMISYRLIPVAMKKHRNIVSGMMYDLLSGKKCEVDFINGAVISCAKEAGFAALLNERALEIIRSIERGERKIEAENIRLFKHLV